MTIASCLFYLHGTFFRPASACMKQRLAISYVRFSTIEQLGGDSIRRQTEATEAYCKRNGLTLTNDYRLRDLGKSAFKGDHRSATGALGILEKQVAEGKIPKGTVLIVENLDRLSREDIVSAQLMLLNLINRGDTFQFGIFNN
ncbi:MAG: recombinase family protein [Verrucomicrobia bacterium]|nr:recombinase family protein [Verrucomicrobiota bacterium]